MMGTALLSAPLLLAGVVALPPVSAPAVSRAEIDGFVRQVKSCWSILPEDVGSGLSVTLRISLGRDGLVTDTEIVEVFESEIGQRLARSALRALVQCAPYDFSTDSYEQWKQLEITLQP